MNASISVIVLFSMLSCVFMLPMSKSQKVAKRAAPSTDNNHIVLARTLSEGLRILKTTAEPVNLPRSINSLSFYRERMTELEFICEIYLTSQNGEVEMESGQLSENATSDGNITSSSGVDILHAKAYSWLNSLSPDFHLECSPECTPSSVEFFCRQVRISNLSYRAYSYLGGFAGTRLLDWIGTHIADENIRRYITCKHPALPCA